MTEHAPDLERSELERSDQTRPPGSGSAGHAGADDRIAAARGFAIAAARHAANTRCTNVIILELAGLSPVTDFFVIATGTSARQMRTVADELAELAQANSYPALGSAGYEGESWILLDCVDVVIHIFSPDARGYYDLDNLWGDARRVEWNE